jgi:serine/threonine protein phosphatase 1
LRFGSYLAVHAGIRPGIALEKQTATDLLSIRRIFLECEDDPGFVVVHGHTPTMEPELRRYRINLDTGAFATNRLTCARVDADGLSILAADGFRIADRP